MTQPDLTEPRTTAELTTGQLIGIAAAACGGAAFLIQALTRDDEPEASVLPTTMEAAPVRSRLHQAVESEAVRTAEQRLQEAAPVVAAYRERARAEVEARRKDLDRLVEAGGKDARAARKQASKRLAQAEKDLKAYRKDAKKLRARAGRAVKDGRKRAHVLGDDVQAQAGHYGAALAGTATAAGLALEHGRERAATLGKGTQARLDDVRSSVGLGEVGHMANDRIRELQERGARAAGQLQSTLKDPNRDLTHRLAEAREQVTAFAQASGKDLATIAQDVREDARRNLPEVTKTVTERAGGIGQQVAEGASRAGKTLSERAAEVADRGSGSGEGTGRAQSTLLDVTAKAAAVAGPALGAIGERVGHLAEGIQEDPGKRSGKSSDQGQSPLLSVRERAAHDVQDLVPGGGKSVEILQDRRSKDQGGDLSSLLQGNLPALVQQVSNLIEQASDKSGTRLGDARRESARLANDAEDQLQSAADRFLEAARHAAKVGDQAVAASSHLRGTTRNAAHKTADAGKDGVESIIWLGAAGVALYYGVLNPDQRATVNKYGARAGRLVGKLITEVRGQDQKF
ncbi:MAG TPA: hypothetical protein VGT61_05950 [Thermomicrobiales bacterium]|jgi:vacuolar-type H+-ATPase subunit H|nr:hypothetical protein [Thermomicrobiales bacterium]